LLRNARFLSTPPITALRAKEHDYVDQAILDDRDRSFALGADKPGGTHFLPGSLTQSLRLSLTTADASPNTLSSDDLPPSFATPTCFSSAFPWSGPFRQLDRSVPRLVSTLEMP
jgi:hypothetical protein